MKAKFVGTIQTLDSNQLLYHNENYAETISKWSLE